MNAYVMGTFYKKCLNEELLMIICSKRFYLELR